MSYSSVHNIPTFQSSDMVWLNWYKDLRKTLSNKQADSIFSMAWSAQNATNSDANTSELRLQMEKYGIEIDGGVLGGIADFGKKTQNYFSDFFTAGKWITIGLAGTLAFSVGALLVQIATKPKVRKEVTQIGTQVATRGLAKTN